MIRLLILSRKILLISLCLPAFANIGSITEHRGAGQLTREAGGTLTTGLELGIQSYDDIRTANGRLAITYDDDTTLSNIFCQGFVHFYFIMSKCNKY